MTREAADIDYDDSHKLRPGATYPPAGEPALFTGAPIELHLLPAKMQYIDPDASGEDAGAELDRTEREAAFIASRIHELMGHDGRPPMKVIDRGAGGAMSPRPVQVPGHRHPAPLAAVQGRAIRRRPATPRNPRPPRERRRLFRVDGGARHARTAQSPR